MGYSIEGTQHDCYPDTTILINKLKKDIAQLNRGEAVICGEFEDTEGNIKKGICYKSAD